ncbi:hypothetical protein [Methylobacterium sp. Leaf102]|uniref:hypothetical protein n=1 Tax=Methylobacterium sp. Leaf102 TaxID=1736253 RepID=UPI0012E730A2|nr:hypothetical protein [Methylobacterium sp. Leaf102]
MLDDEAGLHAAADYGAVEEFAPSLASRLSQSPFPGAARLDVGEQRANRRDPVRNDRGAELRPVVRLEMPWHPAKAEQV